MNSGINRLHKLANSEKRVILGLMSGTSLDGLDMALCEFNGSGRNTKVNVLNFHTEPYDKNFQNLIGGVFSKQLVSLEKLCILNAYIGRTHANLINKTLSHWGVLNSEVDLIASHGQTIFHAPASYHKIIGMPDATLQIGDSDHIAVGTGIITLSDFRQKHIAAGGEGAPLAIYGDYLLFSSPVENRIMLNIGGISNFSFLPKTLDSHLVFSTDTGPGNTLMDAYVRKHFSPKTYDADSLIAKSGTINGSLLAELLNHPFFREGFPKTTGPELFNLDYLQKAQEISGTTAIAEADVVATLNRFSAVSICDALKICLKDSKDFKIYVSGGGMHNTVLISNIRDIMKGIQLRNLSELGISPDAKEAVLFAALANECVTGSSVQFQNKKTPSVTMGKVSFPA
ncbi:anhydro-N-acetylmuramic acid kinase [Rubrolithibacter danxiaensis]|uniref:anhydro-N-acetylmuramic acid kinase n=1 Tax=Rubrolithibacter danxiaensis TaxID=3390805 RepID=UPI003BF81E24